MQARHKCLMLWARQAMLDSSEPRRPVTPEHRWGIEPQNQVEPYYYRRPRRQGYLTRRDLTR